MGSGAYRDYAHLDMNEVEDEETGVWTLDGRDCTQEVFYFIAHKLNLSPLTVYVFTLIVD